MTADVGKRIGSSITARLATVLTVNALFSGGSALVMLGLAGELAGWLEIPEDWLLTAGLALGCFAGFVGWVALRRSKSPGLVGVIAGADLAWVAGAAAVMLIPGSLPATGKLALGLISLVVLDLGLLEWRGSRWLRRS